MRKANSVKN